MRSFITSSLLSSRGDSIIDILSFQPSLSHEYVKAFEYLKMGDSINASGMLQGYARNLLKWTVDISSLPDGIYLVVVRDEKKDWRTAKFIIAQ